MYHKYSRGLGCVGCSKIPSGTFWRSSRKICFSRMLSKLLKLNACTKLDTHTHARTHSEWEEMYDSVELSKCMDVCMSGCAEHKIFSHHIHESVCMHVCTQVCVQALCHRNTSAGPEGMNTYVLFVYSEWIQIRFTLDSAMFTLQTDSVTG